MEDVVNTVFAVLDDFEKEHGRMPKNWDELNAIGEKAKMLRSVGPVVMEEPEPEPDWNEA